MVALQRPQELSPKQGVRCTSGCRDTYGEPPLVPRGLLLGWDVLSCPGDVPSCSWGELSCVLAVLACSWGVLAWCHGQDIKVQKLAPFSRGG